MKLEAYRTMISGTKSDPKTELMFGTIITLHENYKLIKSR
jgi:hypothetical protein